MSDRKGHGHKVVEKKEPFPATKAVQLETPTDTQACTLALRQ